MIGKRGLLRAFRGAGPFKPNLREAEELTDARVRCAEDLDVFAHELRLGTGPRDLVVTRGGDRMAIRKTGTATATPGELLSALSEAIDAAEAGI